MHDTHDSTPSLAEAQARWDAAHAAVVAHAAKGRRNDAVPPEDPDALAAWDAEHAAWVEAWDRVQAESRAAAVALAQARHAEDHAKPRCLATGSTVPGSRR